MTTSHEYDAILIGAARGAVKLVPVLAGAGWKVALVERKHLGGTCVNEGCIPTKTMIASAKVVYLARRAFYVSITRASRALLVTWPETRITSYGNTRLNKPPQFISEAGL